MGASNYNEYRRDGVGRISWRSEGMGDAADTRYSYAYTDRGYLKMVARYDEEGNPTVIYRAAFDKNGNRTYVQSPYHKNSGGWAAYDPQDRLVTFGDYRYEYTDAGALSKKKDNNGTWLDPADDKVTDYRYDQGGNLLEVNLPNGSHIGYTYDALNRRIAKRVDGTTEYKLLYSGQLAPVARFTADDRIAEQYIYGTRVNVPDYMEKDGRKYRLVTDHRGSVRLVVDTHDGAVMQRTDYDESGMIIHEELADGWEPVIFGYAGGLQDRDTGLIRFGARDYDPETGRWTSKEPLGFNGGSNFYVYAGNDPVNKIDPSGKLFLAIHAYISFKAAMAVQTERFEDAVSTGNIGGAIKIAVNALNKSFLVGVGSFMADIGTQGTDAESTRLHSMRGEKNGNYESAEESYEATADYIFTEMEKGNVCHALHASQDLATPVHTGNKWEGGLFPPWEHFKGDFDEGAISQAYQNSLEVLRNMEW